MIVMRTAGFIFSPKSFSQMSEFRYKFFNHLAIFFGHFRNYKRYFSACVKNMLEFLLILTEIAYFLF